MTDIQQVQAPQQVLTLPQAIDIVQEAQWDPGRSAEYRTGYFDAYKEIIAAFQAAQPVSASGTEGVQEPTGWDYFWLVELRPAFEGHPNFPATYYAGWMSGSLDPAKTQDPLAAARFARKEDAEQVAQKLGHTLSCVWAAVEHGFATPTGEAAGAAVQPTPDECKTGNVLLDLMMKHRFGTTQWPENWMAVRNLLIDAQRLAAGAVQPASLSGVAAPAPCAKEDGQHG